MINIYELLEIHEFLGNVNDIRNNARYEVNYEISINCSFSTIPFNCNYFKKLHNKAQAEFTYFYLTVINIL